MVLGCLLAAVGGCGREPTPVFTPRAETAELSPKHQQQIAAALEKYFGSPLHPRFMLVASEQPADAQEPALIEELDRQHLRQGRDLYTRHCAGCHGATGDGQGPAAAYLDPPPRDYRLGKFKFISTARGGKPRRADLARIIHRGAKGTSMPAFRWLPEDEREAVIDYVMLLSSRGELEFRLTKITQIDLGDDDDLPPLVVGENAQLIAQSWAAAEGQLVQPLTPQPPRDDASVAEGARAFVRLNCYKCHGPDGRGNKLHDVGKDDWGRIAHAADLTTGMLHGGRRPVDIYRRIYSGINGTPMPAFSGPDAAQGETDLQRSEKIWRLAHFLTSIVEGRPLPQAVIDVEIKEQLKKIPPAETTSPPPTGG